MEHSAIPFLHLSYLGALASFILTLSCSLHLILYKDDSKSAVGWLGIIFFVPILGAILYILFGINRIRRLAKLKNITLNNQDASFEQTQNLDQDFITKFPALKALVILGNNVLKRPLLDGNALTAYHDGHEAYEAMISSITNAEKTICLSTYIFDPDRVGMRFITALSNARQRGVDIRVLIDDIGLRYSFKTILKHLLKHQIPCARFMGALRPRTLPHINLRKHRKVLIVDGLEAFTGGMNIREGHDLTLSPRHPIQDLHFKLSGPIIAQLQQVFNEDWYFTTKEVLKDDKWQNNQLLKTGNSYARVITDGPDEDINKLSLMMEGAISSAKENILIITPYFIPPDSLLGSLQVAAGKGVKVQIFTPSKNNLPFVKWASHHYLKSLISSGVEVWFTPPPFDHTKLMLVDHDWVLFGSANWDPRSLRLNFELNVEAYDPTLNLQLRQLMKKKINNSFRISKGFF
jgi:cardiolipin synthase A/B